LAHKLASYFRGEAEYSVFIPLLKSYHLLRLFRAEEDAIVVLCLKNAARSGRGLQEIGKTIKIGVATLLEKYYRGSTVTSRAMIEHVSDMTLRALFGQHFMFNRRSKWPDSSHIDMLLK
jgi:hypothetical protein